MIDFLFRFFQPLYSRSREPQPAMPLSCPSDSHEPLYSPFETLIVVAPQPQSFFPLYLILSLFFLIHYHSNFLLFLFIHLLLYSYIFFLPYIRTVYELIIYCLCASAHCALISFALIYHLCHV